MPEDEIDTSKLFANINNYVKHKGLFLPPSYTHISLIKYYITYCEKY